MTDTMDDKQIPADVFLNITSGSRASAQAGGDLTESPADVFLNITSGSPASAQDGDLTEVLFEQLGYLIEFSDQERQRFERVKAILLETFQ